MLGMDVHLDCYFGDEVYYIFGVDKIKKAIIRGFRIYQYYVLYDMYNKEEDDYFVLESDNVYFTREEAKEALEAESRIRRRTMMIKEYNKTKLPFVSGRKYNNLLKNYEDVVCKLETLLLEVTGKLSKSTYPIDVMLSEAIRHTEELVDEAVEKVLEEK